MEGRVILTDRSRLEDCLECRRSRWWAYEWGRGLPVPGGGIHQGGLTAKGVYREPHIGIATHAGLAELLLRPEDVEPAVTFALSQYDDPIRRHGGLAGRWPTQEVHDFAVAEGRAMVEGFVQAAAVSIVPRLLERYKVLEVEPELVFPLDESGEVQFMSRSDAILRERDTEDLVVLSWKTQTQWGAMQERQFRHDMQGLSEAWAVEQTYSEPVMAVQMALLLKGRKEEDKTTPGKTVHRGPLTWAYRIVGDASLGLADQWAWSWDVPKAYERGPKKGQTYLGKLGGNWDGVPVWEHWRMADWVLALAERRFQPECGDPFEKVFLLPEPWSRDPVEMENWRQEALGVEAAVAGVHSALDEENRNTGNPFGALATFNGLCPKNRRACGNRFGAMCQFEPLCYGAAHVQEDPLSNGFRLREPHHEAERREQDEG